MQPGLRRYPIIAARRAPLLAFMLDGLRDAGCRLIYVSNPNEAPYIITFETRDGERLGVVAYAFTATRTPTRNRPDDERSFQIKYGAKELDDGGRPALHPVWQDEFGLLTTIFLGIDSKEGIFVAADPEAHNPTRFYIRLEFKDEHAANIRNVGWTAWERERRPSRTEERREEENYSIETLVGGKRERFLDLIRFERAAQGLSPGDRQLLAERPMLFAATLSDEPAETSVPLVAMHPLETEFELSQKQILTLIAGARRLKMAVRGWVAEEKLREVLSSTDGVTLCERLDEEGGPDLRVAWRGGRPLFVECKNVLRVVTSAGVPRVDFQRTRASKSDPCSRYYAPTDFDVVAGCLHAVTERWEFRYVLPADLSEHTRCPGKITNNVRVDDSWTVDPGLIFERVYAGV